jgi:hypothetical protein
MADLPGAEPTGFCCPASGVDVDLGALAGCPDDEVAGRRSLIFS